MVAAPAAAVPVATTGSGSSSSGVAVPVAADAAIEAIEAQVAASNQTARDEKKDRKQNTPARILAPTEVAQQEVEPVVQPQTSKKEQRKKARDDERLHQKKLEEEKKRAAIDEENARIRKAVDLAHIDDPRRKDGQIVEDSTHDENKASRATGNIEAKNAKAQSKAEATSKSNAEATEVYNSLFK